MMANSSPGSYDPCTSGLYSQAQCCATDVLGLADLNCNVPDETPNSGTDFEAICARTGKQAACCVIPILGQAMLCTKPVGA